MFYKSTNITTRESKILDYVYFGTFEDASHTFTFYLHKVIYTNLSGNKYKYKLDITTLQYTMTEISKK